MTPALRRPPRPNPSAIDDALALERVGQGKLDELGVLFDRYEPDVRRLISRLGVSSGDVDDLVQLTFLDVARSAAKFDLRCSPRSWILGVSAMIVRRHRRSVGRLFKDLAGRVFESRRPSPPTPAEDYEREEEQRRFREALEALSPKLREAFVLATLEGMPGEEVAASLGIPVATLWTRLHNARRALREHLGADRDVDRDGDRGGGAS